LFSSKLGRLVRRETCFDVGYPFHLGLLGGIRTLAVLTVVSGSGLALGLGLVKIRQDALIMLLNNVFGDSFHAEDFNVEAGSVWQGIVDGSQVFLVYLAHVHAETPCSVQSAPASFTFEVLCFLVVDQDLEIVKVALTVVAPRACEDLFEIGVVALLLRHLEVRSRVRNRLVWEARDGRKVAALSR
jgi:hypothetical protein